MNPMILGVLLRSGGHGRAKTFYADGLACPIDQDYPGFVGFKLGDGSSALGLYTWDALAADTGVAADASNGFRGVVLSYIVDKNAPAVEVLAQAEAAGAAIVRPARQEGYGGWSGNFSDLDGYLWNVGSSEKYGTR